MVKYIEIAKGGMTYALWGAGKYFLVKTESDYVIYFLGYDEARDFIVGRA